MSTPVFDPDDPRLTAYALGESTPAEREEVERLLAGSSEARAEVERTLAFVRTLEAEYRQENEAYQHAHRADLPPRKVVAFPAIRRAGWKTTAALAWKIAAVIVALGTFVHFTLRRSSPSGTLASSQPAKLTGPPAPVVQPPAEATPLPGDSARANIPADADQERAPAAAPKARTTPATENADALVAMATEPARRDDASADRASTQPSAAIEDSRVARTSDMRERAAAAPTTSAPGASAKASGGGGASSEDRITQSLVRISTGDGVYIGGVMVTADGWMIAADVVPGDGAERTVILADNRRVPATVSRDEPGLGLHRLLVHGEASPAATLAMKMPADKESLTIATTDRRTGATYFLRAQAVVAGSEARLRWQGQSPAAGSTNLVFNSSGELLVMTDTTPSAKPEVRAKSTSDKTKPTGGMLVRAFTAAERASLRSAAANPTR